MTPSVTNPVKAFVLIALGVAIAAMGIYVANADDAPGAAVIGLMWLPAISGVSTGVIRFPFASVIACKRTEQLRNRV